MSLLAVTSYVEDLLLGVASPAQGPAIVFIGAPSNQVQPITGPIINIYGVTQQDDRRTMGRPLGDRVVVHTIYLWLKALVEPGPEEAGIFPPFIESVKDILRFAPVPVYIYDPLTGERSSATNTGEHFHVDTPPPMDIDNESYRLYEAMIQTTIEEWKIG